MPGGKYIVRGCERTDGAAYALKAEEIVMILPPGVEYDVLYS